jgi:hypothetical protein
MSREAVVIIRLSQVAGEVLAASLDLLQAVEHSDQALVTDAILEAAERLRKLVDENPGDL